MRLCALVLFCLILSPTAVTAQNFMEKESLEGMKAISVVVEKIDAAAEVEGLSREQLQTDVELRLRKAGVAILTPKRPNEVTMPELYIRISTFKLKGLSVSIFAVSINVDVIQTASLIARPKLITATTWSTTALGTVGGSNIRQVKDMLGDAVDQFLNDYLAANPKQ